jgi:hypothetical protein
MLNTRHLSLVSLLTLMALPIAAQESVKCRVGEISSHTFRSKDLSVRLAKLSGYKKFDYERKFSGRANVTLSVENKGSGFQLYSPHDLNFVGKDGVQVFPIFERNFADDTQPMSIRLAPGAHVIMEYALSGRLNFPAKIYLGEILVAEVTE